MIADFPDSEAALDAVLAGQSNTAERSLNTTVTLHRTWLRPPDSLELTVRYDIAAGTPAAISATTQGVSVRLDSPVALRPVTVPKPWGEEIWYSGIEARGESRIAASGGELALSIYLALAPERLCRRRPVMLLKILAPRPRPLLGELYFEVHQQKQEVYVVTGVDPELYPDGAGHLLLGIRQDVRERLHDDARLRVEFADATRAYEQARQRVDAAGEAATQADLDAQMQARRRALEFANRRDVRPGDVIVVPPGIPHALQPGVRVVELQTPSYERQIIWSTQQVATQARWDSAAAIAWMNLDPAPQTPPARRSGPATCVASLPEFGVWRIELSSAERFDLPASLSYTVCIVLLGAVTVSGPQGPLPIGPEMAAFIPAGAAMTTLQATTVRATVLIAAPELTTAIPPQPTSTAAGRSTRPSSDV